MCVPRQDFSHSLSLSQILVSDGIQWSSCCLVVVQVVFSAKGHSQKESFLQIQSLCKEPKCTQLCCILTDIFVTVYIAGNFQGVQFSLLTCRISSIVQCIMSVHACTCVNLTCEMVKITCWTARKFFHYTIHVCTYYTILLSCHFFLFLTKTT